MYIDRCGKWHHGTLNAAAICVPAWGWELYWEFFYEFLINFILSLFLPPF